MSKKHNKIPSVERDHSDPVSIYTKYQESICLEQKLKDPSKYSFISTRNYFTISRQIKRRFMLSPRFGYIRATSETANENTLNIFDISLVIELVQKEICHHITSVFKHICFLLDIQNRTEQNKYFISLQHQKLIIIIHIDVISIIVVRVIFFYEAFY